MVLVFNYGLIGVAIGTFVSMLIRSYGFIIYASKNILKIKLKSALKMIAISHIEIIIFFVIHLKLGEIQVNSYVEWLIIAIIIFVVISILIIITNCILNKDIFKIVLNKMRSKNEERRIH